MATQSDTRRSLTVNTPLLALVGATDLTMQRVRAAIADAEKAVGDPASLQGSAQHTMALWKVMAERAEERYTELAAHGKEVLDRIMAQQSTQDLMAQGRVTVSRTKAAVTTARKAAAGTASAARGTVSTAGREAASAAEQAASAVRSSGRSTQASAEHAARVTSEGAAETRTRAKAATTSAKKTADAALKAAEDAVESVGE